jgi:transcriptional regulator with XRE-family HTH domain
VVVGEQGGPTVQRRLLGSDLRRLREAEGVTRAEAAAVLDCSESKISRLELGQVGFRKRDVEALLRLYGVSDPATWEVILALVREANRPGWWQPFSDVLPTWFERYVGLESAASLIRTYEVQFIPGLLQAEEYARAVTRAGQLPGRYPAAVEDQLDRRVHLRTSRQQVFLNSGAARLWAVIDEAALRRPIGGRRVMRAQLEHLLRLQAHPGVTIQVMPFGYGGHVAQVGAFTILRFAEPDLSDVVYLEHLTGAYYLDKRDDTDSYHAVFTQLAGDSQQPTEAAATLTEILADT